MGPQEDNVVYGQKYVLVDISDQHLYAYQGDTLVFSFVASTGMNNATATGSFSVLNKIPSAYGAEVVDVLARSILEREHQLVA